MEKVTGKTKFKMLHGHCVPLTTPDNFFELAVDKEREQARLNKEMVQRMRKKEN